MLNVYYEYFMIFYLNIQLSFSYLNVNNVNIFIQSFFE